LNSEKFKIRESASAFLLAVGPYLAKKTTSQNQFQKVNIVASTLFYESWLADQTDLQNEHCIWEGFACFGYAVMTILRRKVIVANGRSLGSSTDGPWVASRVSGEVLGRPAV
jgi:hypothetical protein